MAIYEQLRGHSGDQRLAWAPRLEKAGREKRRLAFGLVVAGALTASLYLFEADARYAADPELARLIRAFAFIKLLFVSPLVWSVWRRLAAPASPFLIAFYSVSLSIALAIIAGLAKPVFVAQAPVAFYASLAGFAIVACKDEAFVRAVFGQSK